MPSKWQTRLVIYAGLHHKEQVLLMAKRLKISTNAVVGSLVEVWLKAQEIATETGLLEHKTAMWLDVVVGIDGFAGAMAEVGWLAVGPEGLTVTKYDRHIAKTAVKKCDDVVRKRRMPVAVPSQPDLKPDDLRKQIGNETEKVAVVTVASDVPKPVSKKVKASTALGSPLFDRFWAAYPKKTAKTDAAMAFHKSDVTEELLVRILAAIERQAKGESWRKDGGKFIPYPATWLNGRRWEDEVGVAGSVGTVQPLGRVQSPPGKYASGKRHIIADTSHPPQRHPDAGPGQPATTLFPLEDP